MQETRGRSPGGEDPLQEERATCSSVLASKIPGTEEPGKTEERGRTEEPGRLQSVGSQGDGRDSDQRMHTHTLIWMLHWPWHQLPPGGKLWGKAGGR